MKTYFLLKRPDRIHQTRKGARMALGRYCISEHLLLGYEVAGQCEAASWEAAKSLLMTPCAA